MKMLKQKKKLKAFKSNVSFSSSLSKINNALIDNAEDLDIFIPMFNLLEYSQNYLMKSQSLWNYYRDEVNDVNDNASIGRSFKYN